MSQNQTEVRNAERLLSARLDVDNDAHAAYLTIRDTLIAKTDAVGADVIVDYDSSGNVVGIEILNVPPRTGEVQMNEEPPLIFVPATFGPIKPLKPLPWPDEEERDMCALSMVYDYGNRFPIDYWNADTAAAMKRLIDEAKRFDETTGQPDCEDPSKAEFLEQIDALLERVSR